MNLLHNNLSSVYKKLKYPNCWDLLAFTVAFVLIGLFAWSAKQMVAPYQIGSTVTLSLAPCYLPLYALFTVMRMFVALFFSLLFTLTIGTWAAKSKLAGKILIPLIDVLQSVPILGFLSITVVFFIKLFPDSLLGPECAAIFAIFTSQAWNLALGFYQSILSVPVELKEAAQMFHLSAWQRFWRIEISYALPNLLWNMMISMSAGWFFVVAAEGISIANQTILLPGIGSYIAVAIAQANVSAICAAIVTMFIVILLYDQIFFRPLVAWSEKFKAENTPGVQEVNSWFLDILMRTRLLRTVGVIIGNVLYTFINLRWFCFGSYKLLRRHTPGQAFGFNRKYLFNYQLIAWFGFAACLGGLVMWLVYNNYLYLTKLLNIVELGLFTAARVTILVILCSFIWVPIGVYIGLNPKLTKISQPIAQFLAAFPANLFYPLVIMVIVKLHVSPEVGLTPLMILGAQWYILFNIISGAAMIPKEFLDVAENFRVKYYLRWRRIILPAIFPYYITGAITAAGGAWNASIVSEVVSWGNTKIVIPGLGSYISAQATSGEFSNLALAIGVMSVMVVLINRLFWHPLYIMALERYS